MGHFKQANPSSLLRASDAAGFPAAEMGQIIGDSIHCKSCSTEIMTPQRDAAVQLARVAALAMEAQLKRAATQQTNALAQHAWKPADQPTWLTRDFYSEKIQPALLAVRGSSIARTIKVSNSYAQDIRKGRVVPHPRHWGVLAKLVGHPSIS